MNRMQLIKAVSEQIQCKRNVVKAVVESTLSVLVHSLYRRDTVQLMGFGSFKVKRRKARRSHLPGSTDPIVIPATNVVSFSAGKALKEMIQKTPPKEKH